MLICVGTRLFLYVICLCIYDLQSTFCQIHFIILSLERNINRRTQYSMSITKMMYRIKFIQFVRTILDLRCMILVNFKLGTTFNLSCTLFYKGTGLIGTKTRGFIFSSQQRSNQIILSGRSIIRIKLSFCCAENHSLYKSRKQEIGFF